MKQKSTDPKMTYSMTCRVTGVETPTNPKQYGDLMIRYAMTAEDMKNSYVSRAGRKILTEEKLTPEQACEKYGIHMNVATRLKATVKAPVVIAKPEVPANVIEVSPQDITETKAPVTETKASDDEVFYDASKDNETVEAKAVVA